QAGIWAGAAGIAIGIVLVPLRANIACRTGEQFLANDVRLARAKFNEAAGLNPGHDFYWGRLATASQLLVKSAAAADKVDCLLESHRAFERAIDLVPVNADYHAGLARVLMELARERLVESSRVFEEYERATELDPTNPYYLASAANAALVLNDLSRA